MRVPKRNIKSIFILPLDETKKKFTTLWAAFMWWSSTRQFYSSHRARSARYYRARLVHTYPLRKALIDPMLCCFCLFLSFVSFEMYFFIFFAFTSSLMSDDDKTSKRSLELDLNRFLSHVDVLYYMTNNWQKITGQLPRRWARESSTDDDDVKWIFITYFFPHSHIVIIIIASLSLDRPGFNFQRSCDDDHLKKK